MTSGGAKGVPNRVSIPSAVKKTIDNIKEITGQNHSEDDIYAILKECSVDPNETAQRLLLLDTFHEVKRKRDKRKEKLNKEPSELTWKAATQARASRGGHGNYAPRFVSPGGGRNSAVAKGKASVHLTEKGSKAHIVTPRDIRKNETSAVASSITAVSNGPSGITSESANAVHNNNHASAGEEVNQLITISGMSGPEGSLLLSSPADSIKSSITLGNEDMQQHQMLELSNSSASIPSLSASGSSLSSSDPIIVPSPNLPFPSAMGTICRDVGSQHGTAELINNNPTGGKLAPVKIASSEIGVPDLKQKTPNDIPVVEKSQHVEPVQTASSTVSRPSSNYNNCSQIVLPSKVGHGKEWKPKSSNVNTGQGVTVASASDECLSESQTAPADLTSKEDILDLQRKLESSHISDSQHVIIPNHLHVPEVEKLGFCFGSFNASFGLDIQENGVSESDKSPLSESSEVNDEQLKELQLSHQDVVVPAEDVEIKCAYQTLSPSKGPDKFPSNEVEETSSVNPVYVEKKPEVTAGSNQHLAVNTSSNPNYGVMPPIMGGHITPLETSESQPHDAPQLPSFVLPQSFDPVSYYSQFYRSGMDADGRISPIHLAGAANKYNGNVAVISGQTSQTPQEGGAALILSTPPPTPLVTQAAGLMQSTISGAQQPLPVFRQPSGVHFAHYPPNYIPYGPYFPQFYVPPPEMHSFLSNGAFPQQPQAGSLYPTAAGTAAKYSVFQYKQGLGTGSPAHLGVPGSYGPYGLSMANYSSGSSTSPVTTTSNEDDVASQNKENNVYASGQPNEGSGVWFTTPSRDFSTLQTSSFYNLPPGQLAFTPTQPGHGTFTGMFHPGQAVTTASVHPLLQQSQSITNAGDMVGPTSGIYPQPQHTQLNWLSNY